MWKALEFGAKGIGLCRTEHMFFDNLDLVRGMILAKNDEERKHYVDQLGPVQEEDFRGMFDGFFSLLISGAPQYKQLAEISISRLMKISHLSEIMGRKIEQFLEQEPERIINILVNFLEEETKQRIAVNLFLNILDYSKLPDISDKLMQSSENGIKLLKNTLIETLKLISIENKEHYTTILEICIGNIKNFNQSDKHRIIAKINPLFSYGDLEKTKALELLDNVDRFPRKSISLISTSLEEISDLDNEDSNILLNRVKKKINEK